MCFDLFLNCKGLSTFNFLFSFWLFFFFFFVDSVSVNLIVAIVY